jgi:hypothetical protein
VKVIREDAANTTFSLSLSLSLSLLGAHMGWEIIADNLRKRGWSLGRVSAIDSEGRTIWIVDAHRDNGKRFVVRADEMLTAFIELQAATAGQNPV